MNFNSLNDNVTEILPLQPEQNPVGTIVAFIVLTAKQRLMNESDIEVVAVNVKNHPFLGDHLAISAKHLTGPNAGGFSTRQIIIPNNPPSVPRQAVRFMEFNREYEVRTYVLGQVSIIAIDAIHFLLNGDLPEENDD
jgi:hypothetical protein